MGRAAEVKHLMKGKKLLGKSVRRFGGRNGGREKKRVERRQGQIRERRKGLIKKRYGREEGRREDGMIKRRRTERKKDVWID